MMRLRIYIDTSVIGGCLDKEFQNASRQLIDKFKHGEMIAVISELTTLELKDAPQEVRDIIREIPEENIDYEELTEEAVNLARKYIVEGVIGDACQRHDLALAHVALGEDDLHVTGHDAGVLIEGLVEVAHAE